MAGSQSNWLSKTQNDLLAIFYNKRPTRASLKVQLFVFIKDRVLLLQPEGRNNAWTVPSNAIAENLVEGGQQSIWKIAVKMLRHAIQERALHNLQLADIASYDSYVESQWKNEKLHPTNTTKEVPLSIILTAESSKLDDTSTINYPNKYTKLKWLTFNQASILKLEGLPLARLRKSFVQIQKYVTNQQDYIANRRLDCLLHSCNLAAPIQLGIRTIDYGAKIPYAIFLVLKDEPATTIYIVDISKSINDRIEPVHYVHQEVVDRFPLPGGHTQTNRYRIVGRGGEEVSTHFHRALDWKSLFGVWGEGPARLNMKFMCWGRTMVLEDPTSLGSLAAPS